MTITPAVGRVTDHDIVRVREASALADIFDEHTNRAEDGITWWCPFCADRFSYSPTLTIGRVTRESNGAVVLELWHCPQCDNGGDVINFVRKVEGLGYFEAIEYLAKRAGIQFVEPSRAEVDGR